MKKILISLIALAVLIVGIYLYNYYRINYPVQTELNNDPRNSGINITTHYENYIEPNTLILDLKEFSGDKSKMDIFRTLLQTAYALKDDDFKSVNLQYQGKDKFIIPGSYFKELGKGYNDENQMYTIRTFPENILDLNGNKAYESVEGGFLGVLNAQMDNFNDFSKKWYASSYENN